MKIPKSLVGKAVRIQWKDPRSAKVKSIFPDSHKDIVRGRASLATWTEWGVIEDVSEDVLHLRQGLAIDPPLETDQSHEVVLSIVPFELIELIVPLLDSPEDQWIRG